MVLGSPDHPDWIAIQISCNLGDYTERLEGVVRGVVTSNLVVTTQGGVVTTPPF